MVGEFREWTRNTGGIAGHSRWTGMKLQCDGKSPLPSTWMTLSQEMCGYPTSHLGVGTSHRRRLVCGTELLKERYCPLNKRSSIRWTGNAHTLEVCIESVFCMCNRLRMRIVVQPVCHVARHV